MSGSESAVRAGRVVLPQETVVDGLVVVAGGVIQYAGPWGAGAVPQGCEVWHLPGATVAPGFIDTHFHGTHGDDVMLDGPEGLRRIASRLLESGVTGWLPTTLSARHEEILRALAAVREVAGEEGAARILGVHIEGPYINRAKKGAQPEEGIRDPDLGEARELLETAGGLARVVTLAPELPGAFELMDLFLSAEVKVSMGHTDADYETACRAIDAGATGATHLFNQMSGLHHRAPGVVTACLNDPRVTVEVIADGVHLHPAVVRLVMAAKERDRIALITDAMAATGLPDGEYRLGANRVLVRGDLCTLMDGKTIASSRLTMNRAVKNAVAFAGVPLHDAVRMASLIPAETAGVADRMGSLETGKDGDLVILREDYSVQATVVGGRVLYGSFGSA